MTERGVTRVLAGLCVVLAMMCMSLAFAYGRKVQQMRCYAEAAEIGLIPPENCESPPYAVGTHGRLSPFI